MKSNPGKGETKEEFPLKLCFVFAEMVLVSIGRLVEDAIDGKYLNSSFSVPCPPGLDVPPEVFSPFTTNNLKVSVHENLQPVLITYVISFFFMLSVK